MQNEMQEKFEDWRGKETITGKHGGIKAASLACGKFLKPIKQKKPLKINKV